MKNYYELRIINICQKFQVLNHLINRNSTCCSCKHNNYDDQKKQKLEVQGDCSLIK